MSKAEELAEALRTGDRSGIWYSGMEAAAELRRLSSELAECKAAYESQFKELHALKAQEENISLKDACLKAESQAKRLPVLLEQIAHLEATASSNYGRGHADSHSMLSVQIAQLEAQLLEARKDAERLDWMERTNQRGHYCGVFSGNLLTRAAIDAAISKEREK